MSKRFFLLASALGFLSVVLGAFAAHGLEEYLAVEMISVYQTGVQYQMFHVLPLFVVAMLSYINKEQPIQLVWSGYCFVLGVILFSGSLYLLSITGITRLGIITPIGGVAFLLGWSLLFYSIFKHHSEKHDG